MTDGEIRQLHADIEEILVLVRFVRDVAVPKPSRIAEKYAALTLSIVLLREQVMSDGTPVNRKIVVEKELCELIKKRIELEGEFESENHEGGA
jgi:hypothetical protein